MKLKKWPGKTKIRFTEIIVNLDRISEPPDLEFDIEDSPFLVDFTLCPDAYYRRAVRVLARATPEYVRHPQKPFGIAYTSEDGALFLQNRVFYPCGFPRDAGVRATAEGIDDENSFIFDLSPFSSLPHSSVIQKVSTYDFIFYAKHTLRKILEVSDSVLCLAAADDPVSTMLFKYLRST